MKQIVSTVATCLVLGTGAVSVSAQDSDLQDAQPGIESSSAVTSRGTVQDIDYQNRTVTLKGQNGKTRTVKVGPEARNFNQIRKGDQVTFRREESLAISIRRSDEPATSGEAQTLMRAPAGEKPSGAVVTTTQITATVDKIDRENGKVTLRTPKGETRTLKAQDPEAMDRLHKGDQVVATYTETFMIDVAAPQ